MGYEFPHGACEQPVYGMWADGSGSHACAAGVNVMILCLVFAHWCVHATRSTHPSDEEPQYASFTTLLAAEMVFEAVHCGCHLKHNAFCGQCFHVQHMAALILLFALHAVVATIARRPLGSFHVPLLVVLADVVFALLGSTQLPRALVAFVAFAVLLSRARSTASLRDQGLAQVAVSLLVLTMCLFWAEGSLGCDASKLPHARVMRALGIDWLAPPHAVIEFVNFWVFATTNIALERGLDLTHASILKAQGKRRVA